MNQIYFFGQISNLNLRMGRCAKDQHHYDLKPELGSGLPGRWRLRPTLPGSRVTRREMQVGDPHMAEMKE